MVNEIKIKPKLPIRIEKIKDEKYQVLERMWNHWGPHPAGVSVNWYKL